jgi:SAM-dependent methyltransferase
MKWVSATCPSCGNHGLQQFYSVDNIPVNSCLVVDDEGAGRSFPRGDLRVALCERCGFITNTAFDLRRLSYDSTYEETQIYSPTFVAFQDALIGDLLERYDLCGKTVVEVGCGKGDFLARMAELGGIHGIGIDPTSVQERLTGVAGKNVRFINEFYGPQHAAIPADILICRHALEHIPNVGEFLRTIRAAVGERPIPIFFELPETLHVLRASAYWDIYFEHCGYFTPGSLARAFASAGLRVTDVGVGYDDQYLMLHAVTGDSAPAYAGVLDTPSEIVAAVRDFEESVESKLCAWRSYFSAAQQAGRRIAIWGSGSKCVAFLTTLELDQEIAWVTDVNPYRHGKHLVGTGRQIVPPEALRDDVPDEVIVMNPIYRDEVVERLHSMGITTSVITAETPREVFA